MTDQQRATLEALKELKAEYYIGSQNAFNYLKARRWLESLRDSVIALAPDAPFRKRLTIQQIAWMIETLSWRTSCLLRRLAAEASTPSSWSTVTSHRVYLPLPQTWEDKDTSLDSHPDICHYRWSFDNTLVLDKTLRHTHTADEQIQDVDRRFLLAATAFFAEAVVTNLPFLTFQKTGEQVSLPLFKEETRFRQGSPEGWEGTILWNVEKSDEIELTREERKLLAKADAGDMIAAHDFIRRTKIREINSRLKEGLQEALEVYAGGGMSGDEWIYDHKLWERAKAEYTLGYVAVERRIALYAVQQHKHRLQFSASVSQFLDDLVRFWQEILRERSARQQKLQAVYAPYEIQQSSEDLIAQARYTMLALRQNKKWLIDFLSR